MKSPPNATRHGSLVDMASFNSTQDGLWFCFTCISHSCGAMRSHFTYFALPSVTVVRGTFSHIANAASSPEEQNTFISCRNQATSPTLFQPACTSYRGHRTANAYSIWPLGSKTFQLILEKNLGSFFLSEDAINRCSLPCTNYTRPFIHWISLGHVTYLVDCLAHSIEVLPS